MIEVEDYFFVEVFTLFFDQYIIDHVWGQG